MNNNFKCFDKFIANPDLTEDEMFDNVVLRECDPSDILNVADAVMKTFGLPTLDMTLRTFDEHKVDLYNSVLAVDAFTDEIYGVLLFAYHPLSSEIRKNDISFQDFLQTLDMVEGHAFLLDERLRGKGIDKEMLDFAKPFLNTFDAVWCGVDNDMKSHKYWERLGFKKMGENHNACFYMKATDLE